MKILLCMATGQNAASILPLESQNTRPALVCVGVTSGTHRRGEAVLGKCHDLLFVWSPFMPALKRTA